MGNGIQEYEAHGQWGTVSNGVQGYRPHGQWGTTGNQVQGLGHMGYRASNVSECQKMSSCQKDVKCQKIKHLDYGGGSQKKNKLTQ